MKPSDLDSIAHEVDSPNASDHRRIRSAHRSAAQWKALANALERENAELEEQLTVLGDLKRSRAESERVSIAPKRKSGSGEAVAFAVASDWHVEETVRPEQVSGLNEHNLEIADEKVKHFYRNVTELVRLGRNGREIRTLVHPLLGDLFSGHIHPDLVEVTALSPTQCLVWLEQRLETGIRYLLDSIKVERIIIPCCWGNHGRTTVNPRISTADRHSYEWLLYVHLSGVFSKEKRVQFVIADGYHVWLDVLGVQVRMHHGDAIRYGGGIGGITIPVNKAIANWNRAKRADVDIFGHYHQLMFMPNFIANGSLIGYGPYSVHIGASYEPPAQAFFLVDGKHRRVSLRAPIWLEEKK